VISSNLLLRKFISNKKPFVLCCSLPLKKLSVSKRLVTPDIYIYSWIRDRYWPEAASCVAEDLGGVEVHLAVLLRMRRRVPARVGDDHSVGQHGEGVLDDGHLQGVARRQVPQNTWGGGGETGCEHQPVKNTKTTEERQTTPEKTLKYYT